MTVKTYIDLYILQSGFEIWSLQIVQNHRSFAAPKLGQTVDS